MRAADKFQCGVSWHVIERDPHADSLGTIDTIIWCILMPWHQDAPYYCVDSAKTVSMWIPLDYVPRDTTLEFICGSHKWTKFYRPQRFDGSALNENDRLEAIPDINGHRGDR